MTDDFHNLVSIYCRYLIYNCSKSSNEKGWLTTERVYEFYITVHAKSEQSLIGANSRLIMFPVLSPHFHLCKKENSISRGNICGSKYLNPTHVRIRSILVRIEIESAALPRKFDSQPRFVQKDVLSYRQSRLNKHCICVRMD